MINLDFPNAVSSMEKFYNHQSELERSLKALFSGNRVPVVIIGERRIGKTSLHNVVLEQVREKSSQSLALVIEPRGIETVDQFVEAILRRINLSWKKDLRETGLYDERGRIHLETPDQFDLAVQRLAQPESGEVLLLLCIDEFDEIIRLVTRTGESEKSKLFGLIHHLIEGTPLKINLFFTMTRVPEPIQEDFPSPLITKAEIIKLSPFDESTTSEMIDWLVQGQVGFTDSAKAALYHLSGGHPYFIKLLLSNLLAQPAGLENRLVNQDEICNQVLSAALDDTRARYAIENIYKAHFSPMEKRVLLYLAERDELVKSEEFQMAGREIVRAVRSLLNRHYLEEEHGMYGLRIRFLGVWLRNWLEFEEELERLNVHQIADLNINKDQLDDIDRTDDFLDRYTEEIS